MESNSEKMCARGDELRESHSLDEIEKAIVEVEKLDTRESAVTADVLKTISEQSN